MSGPQRASDGHPADDGVPGAEAAGAARSDADRRTFLKRVAITSAVATPAVMSFSLDGLLIHQSTAAAAGTLAPGPNVIQDPGFDIA